jgi:S1-C subfamily serine protease
MPTNSRKFWRVSLAGVLASGIIGGVLTSVLVTGPTSAATPASSDPGLALQADFVRVVKEVRPSVVEISTTTGLGSGVVYDNKGDIVTNAHVVGTETSFTVSLSNGQKLAAHLIGVYAPDDLAVIKVTTVKGLTPAHLGNSASLEVGNIVLAIGNPLGLSSSVTDGIVSFNGRAVSEGNGVVLPNLIQTSAAINPGNSGGALVNISGQVVGIPTLGATNGSAAAPGLGFAIPTSTVSLIVPQLIAKGKVTTAGRAALGVSANDAYSLAGAPVGVVVTAIQAGGPAAKAGIVSGELITAINAFPILAVSDLQTLLARLMPGNRVTISVTNPNGQKRSTTAVLADLAQI